MSKDHKLKTECLNFSELLAQNIALISPTMTAALIVPLMFATVGNISWLAYGLGTLLLLFVAFNLNQFSKRFTGTGSMYTYTSMALGPTTGSLCGWCLIWSYLFIGLAGTTGFTIFSSKLLEAVGIHAPPLLLFAICIGSCFILAYKDIVISTIVMLVLEGVSCSFILLLCLIVLGKHGFAIDTAQFDFKDASITSLGLGVVVAIFSLVGFESSTAFGEEAKNPLKTIPKSIVWSLILTGGFFIFVAYTEILGTRGYSQPLNAIDSPLTVLATIYKVPILAIPLELGAMVSFYALALSCLNAGSRVMFAMGRHGIFHPAMRNAHPTNGTPHIALGVLAVLMFAVVAIFKVVAGYAVLDEFGYAGTMGAFGFMGSYILITIAAPIYLKKIGQLKPRDVTLCIAGLLLLAIPAVGSVYPVPPSPLNYFPYIFLGYVAIGVVRALAFKAREPHSLVKIREELRDLHLPSGFAMEQEKA
ncbi:MAG: APC family permease [Terrimicrobiaceae bacterium]|nr:APC family permease [Terrimicrobiaceae bacterium]